MSRAARAAIALLALAAAAGGTAAWHQSRARREAEAERNRAAAARTEALRLWQQQLADAAAAGVPIPPAGLEGALRFFGGVRESGSEAAIAAAALLSIGDMLMGQGELDPAERAFWSAKKAADRTDARLLGRAEASLGEVAFARGQGEAAQAAFRRAAGVFAAAGAHRERAGCLTRLGSIALAAGNGAGAAAIFRECLEPARTLFGADPADAPLLANTVLWLADAERQAGQPAAALPEIESTLAAIGTASESAARLLRARAAIRSAAEDYAAALADLAAAAGTVAPLRAAAPADEALMLLEARIASDAAAAHTATRDHKAARDARLSAHHLLVLLADQSAGDEARESEAAEAVLAAVDAAIAAREPGAVPDRIAGHAARFRRTLQETDTPPPRARETLRRLAMAEATARALAGESEAAFAALERAHAEGVLDTAQLLSNPYLEALAKIDCLRHAALLGKPEC